MELSPSGLGKVARPLVPPIVTSQFQKAAYLYRAHKHNNRGKTSEVGELQFDFLVNNGLSKDDKLLDIGCGPLRGGVHFIEYLNSGNYFGVDKRELAIIYGEKKVLPDYDLRRKEYTLKTMENFNFQIFDKQFDYIIAQSVFTHLPWNSIARCLLNVRKVLGPDSEFYATFNEVEALCTGPTESTGGYSTSIDSDPYHYTYGTFRKLCDGIEGLDVEYIGNWGHPREQKMLVFRTEESTSESN